MAAFTADSGEVARRLPSPQLHPLRWFNGKAVAVVLAADWVMTIGDVPLGRAAEVSVGVAVTHGRSPAVPVLPMAATKLPLVGGALDRRFQWGLYYLDSVVTNRVAAEVNRFVWGEPGSVAAIRQDCLADRLRVTATDPVGVEVVSLEVATGGRSQPVDQFDRAYFVQGSNLVRRYEHNMGRTSMRLGRSSACLRLGLHPLADLLRSLCVSTRPLLAMVESCEVTFDQAPDRLELVDQPRLPPTALAPIVAPMVINHEDGREETVDQMLDTLPFNVTGTFEHAAA